MISQELYDKLHKKEFDEAKASKIIPNKFPDSLEEIEKENKAKPERISFLEEIFNMSSDKAHQIAFKILNGLLQKQKLSVAFLEDEKNKICAYLGYIGVLGKEYYDFSWDVPPNYDKFVDYTLIAIDKLELEISRRSKQRNL